MSQAWVALLSLIVLAGCQQPDLPPANLLPVEGSLMLDGAPLAGAAISLVPQTSQGQAAGAISDAGGHFSLVTLNRFAGAPPGEYKVVITGRPVGGYVPTPASAASLPQATLPLIYGTPATTPVRLTVPAAQPLVIELRSPKPAKG